MGCRMIYIYTHNGLLLANHCLFPAVGGYTPFESIGLLCSIRACPSFAVSNLYRFFYLCSIIWLLTPAGLVAPNGQ